MTGSSRILAALLLAAYLASLFLTRIEARLPLLTFAAAALLLAAYQALRSARRGDAFVLPAGAGILLACVYLVYVFAAVSWSTLPEVSLWFAWIVGAMPLVYLIRLAAAQQDASWEALWRGLLSLTAALAVWGLVEYVYTAHRARGPFLDINAYAALFYLFLCPAFIGYAQSAPGSRSRRLYFAFLALALPALFATYSRGAIGVFLLLLPLLLLALRRARQPVLRPGLSLLLTAALAYAAVKWAVPNIERPVADLAGDPSTQARLLIWRSAWAIWRDHPWLGTSLGSFKLYYLRYRNPAEIGSSGDLAHNDYLQFLAEGGPLLLGLLLSLGGYTLSLAWRAWRRLPGPEAGNALQAFGLSVAVLGLFVHALVNFIFYVPALALLGGLFLAQARHQLGPLRTWRLPWPVHPRLTGFAYGVAAMLLVGALAVDSAASLTLDKDNTWLPARLHPQSDQALYHLASVLTALRPNNVLAQQTLTTSAMNLAMTHSPGPVGQMWASQALLHGQRWLAASQGNPYAYLTLGQILWHFPMLEEQLDPGLPADPQALLELAITHYPMNPTAYRVLAQYQQAQGQPAQAYATLQRGLAASPSSATPELAQAWQQLTREALALAVSQQDTARARELARLVLRFEPQNTTAQQLLQTSPVG